MSVGELFFLYCYLGRTISPHSILIVILILIVMMMLIVMVIILISCGYITNVTGSEKKAKK